MWDRASELKSLLEMAGAVIQSVKNEPYRRNMFVVVASPDDTAMPEAIRPVMMGGGRWVEYHTNVPGRHFIVVIGREADER